MMKDYLLPKDWEQDNYVTALIQQLTQKDHSLIGKIINFLEKNEKGSFGELEPIEFLELAPKAQSIKGIFDKLHYHF